MMVMLEEGSFWWRGTARSRIKSCGEKGDNAGQSEDNAGGEQGADCGGELGCSPPPSVTHRQPCNCQHDQQGRGICLPPSYLSLSLCPEPQLSSSSSSSSLPLLHYTHRSCRTAEPVETVMNKVKDGYAQEYFTSTQSTVVFRSGYFISKELLLPHDRMHTSSAQLNQRVMFPSYTVWF